MLCDLEAGPNVHAQQLRRLHVLLQQVTRHCISRAKQKKDQIGKTPAPATSYFYFGSYRNGFESDELPRLFWLSLVFCFAFLTSHSRATGARAREPSRIKTNPGPEKAPRQPELIHFPDTISGPDQGTGWGGEERGACAATCPQPQFPFKEQPYNK